MKEDWIEVELGEVCDINMGQSPPSSTYNIESNGLPFFQGKAEFTDLYPIVKKWCTKPTRIANEGDILLSVRAPVGSTNIANQKCAIGRGLAAVSYPFSNKIIWYFLKSIEQLLDKQGTGTTFRAVSGNIVRKQIFPLAPLPIQRAIVSKIEALFSDLDNGIANFKKAQAQLKIYRQAVLKKAFEGELTKEWREKQSNLPTAEELLQQIKQERQNHYNQQVEDWKKAVKEWEKNGKVGDKPRKSSQPQELSPLKKEELEELPILPDGWVWVKLGFLSQKIQIGPFGTQLHKHDYISEGVPIINPKHIKHQKITPDIFISDEKAKSLSQYLLKTNDVILGRRGEMGRTALITEKQNNWMCGTGSLFVRFPEMFVGKFYSLILSERRIVNYLNNNGSGTTMTNLNNSIINELPIQLLSIQEQHQIVQEIERRLSVCDKMEQSIKESIEKAEALRQSILKKAFEGKLLSQSEIAQCKKEADYEPASELLKKIKADASTRSAQGKMAILRQAQDAKIKKPTVKNKSKQ